MTSTAQEAAMTEPSGGLTAYVNQVRADHHRLSGLTADGVGSWCSCGLEECTALWLLDHIDNLTLPAHQALGQEHTYALSVARSAVLKAAGKFVTAADMYRKRDLLRSVQEMADSERACVRVASFLADEIASARAERCRCGVRRGTEHVRNCTERCQDCSGAVDGPRRCRCAD